VARKSVDVGSVEVGTFVRGVVGEADLVLCINADKEPWTASACQVRSSDCKIWATVYVTSAAASTVAPK
jgi:hypothetical protein